MYMQHNVYNDIVVVSTLELENPYTIVIFIVFYWDKGFRVSKQLIDEHKI